MCVRYKFNFYYFYKPSRCLTRTGQFCVKTLVKNKLNQLLILGNSVTHLERLASQLDCLLVHCRRYLVDILGILNGWMDRWIVDITWYSSSVVPTYIHTIDVCCPIEVATFLNFTCDLLALEVLEINFLADKIDVNCDMVICLKGMRITVEVIIVTKYYFLYNK